MMLGRYWNTRAPITCFYSLFLVIHTGTQITSVNPNLLDPVNFVPFGKIRYSNVAINLINIHEYNLPMTCICLFLNKA